MRTMKQLENCHLNEYVVPDGYTEFYFRYDIWPEGTAKENWSLYCEIQDELRTHHVELVDPCIEHDCISGYLKPVECCCPCHDVDKAKTTGT